MDVNTVLKALAETIRNDYAPEEREQTLTVSELCFLIQKTINNLNHNKRYLHENASSSPDFESERSKLDHS
jgi:hypothetical protein